MKKLTLIALIVLGLFCGLYSDTKIVNQNSDETINTITIGEREHRIKTVFNSENKILQYLIDEENNRITDSYAKIYQKHGKLIGEIDERMHVIGYNGYLEKVNYFYKISFNEKLNLLIGYRDNFQFIIDTKSNFVSNAYSKITYNDSISFIGHTDTKKYILNKKGCVIKIDNDDDYQKQFISKYLSDANNKQPNNRYHEMSLILNPLDNNDKKPNNRYHEIRKFDNDHYIKETGNAKSLLDKNKDQISDFYHEIRKFDNDHYIAISSSLVCLLNKNGESISEYYNNIYTDKKNGSIIGINRNTNKKHKLLL